MVSRELRSRALEEELVARMQQFDFGTKDMEVMDTTYPFDFLPGWQTEARSAPWRPGCAGVGAPGTVTGRQAGRRPTGRPQRAPL